MERWQGKVAVVTGASSGIGAAVAKSLVEAGLVVVGLARREDKILQLRYSLPPNRQLNLHGIKCDITNEDDVARVFSWIEETLGGTDVLVNNAGVARNQYCLVSPDNSAAMKEVLDTNVMGVMYSTREAFKSMKARSFDGHILVVNSVLGHKVMSFIGGQSIASTNMYSPSKFAVSAMVETYRQEFLNAGTKVKITSISPGLVNTEILSEKTRKMQLPMLEPTDIAEAILYAISTPPHVQVHDLIIKPVGEPI